MNRAVNHVLSLHSVNRKIISLFVALGLAALVIYAHHRGSTAPIDRIVVEKSSRTLSIFRGGKKLKSYRVALGRNPVGAKEEEGDMKTPEGVYKIDNRKADSDYHLALHISYPAEDDNARAAARGVSAGSDIEIHGLPNGHGAADFHPASDWTAGCIAISDAEIEELWRVTPEGTIVEIKP
jgi:murein L,D-transpeptidase YafK